MATMEWQNCLYSCLLNRVSRKERVAIGERQQQTVNHLIPLIKAWGHNKKMGLAKKGNNEETNEEDEKE
jgi:hypothetical protein